MELSRREKAGMWIGVISTVIPGLIAAGFFPDFNLLPAASWLLIASLGGAVAGIVASPSVGWGAVSGLLAGGGLMLGIWAYVAVRFAITGGDGLYRFEIGIGALLGATPGLIVFVRHAKAA